MKNILEGLNKEQKQAVTHESGPLLIVAGAGTGKTAVITRRIAWLISKKHAEPSEILALTFTDKAAAEMESRVDELVPYGFIDTWISTFHAFGDRILRDHALDLGLPSDFKVLTRPEQAIFIQDHLFQFDLNYYRPLGNPMKYINELLSHFSRLKDEDINPDEYINFVQKQKTKDKEEKQEVEKQLELANAYRKYQELMQESGNLDFGDQIILTIKLFKEHPKILKKYQNQFKYILVDEFQDTNYAQNKLVNILAKKRGNITVVGDDDQSIYRFRGAAISNILEFKKIYPKAKQVVLVKNYRSIQEILDSAYKLIRHNDPDRLEVENNINKKLIAQVSKKVQKNVNHIHCDTISSETDRVVSFIKEKIKSKKYRLNDFAILIRKNNQAQAFMHAFNYYGIPYNFTGNSGLYDRPEVRLIIHFIKTITDVSDSLSFYHLITSEVYTINTAEAVKLTSYAKKNNRQMLNICQNLSAAKKDLDLKKDSIDALGKICCDLEKYQENSKKDTAGQVIYSFLKNSGYLKELVKNEEKDVEAQIKIQNISKFFEKITQFEHVSTDKSLISFARHLEVLMEAGEDPATAEIDPEIEAVNILTVHKAKGLEFNVVFLVNLVNGHFPTYKRNEVFEIPDGLIKETLPKGDWHLEEERRLFYVGMTRAKNELYLTSAENYGGKRAKKVSQFVLEALDRPKVDKSKYKLTNLELIKKFEKPKEIIHLPKRFYTDGKLKLTPHQIDDYLSCPKKFAYIHILKVPIMRYHPVVYGSAVHKAVEEYFARKIGNHKVSIDDIIITFSNAWVSEGFVTREHEKKRFEAGKVALRNFFEREEKEKRLPKSIEERFEFELSELDLKVNGRYDAVYQDNSSFTEIRDFKTSEVKEEEKAVNQAKRSRQLSIYALSWLKNKDKLPNAVSLYFVETGIIAKVEKTEKDIKKAKEEMEKVVNGIKKEEFSASPSWGECRICAYREICPYTETGG